MEPSHRSIIRIGSLRECQKRLVADLGLTRQRFTKIRQCGGVVGAIVCIGLPEHFEKFIPGDVERLEKHLVERAVKEAVRTSVPAIAARPLSTIRARSFTPPRLVMSAPGLVRAQVDRMKHLRAFCVSFLAHRDEVVPSFPPVSVDPEERELDVIPDVVRGRSNRHGRC